MFPGDLATDDDVRLVVIAGFEEAPLFQRRRIHSAFEFVVRGDVLPLDHRGVEKALDLLFLRFLKELHHVPGDQAGILDRRREAPEFGGDGGHAGNLAQLVAQTEGQLAEDRRGGILALDHDPLDLVERRADQVPEPVRDAEETQHPEDGHREPHQCQDGSEWTG